MNGLEKARQTAENIKKAAQEEQLKEETAMQEVTEKTQAAMVTMHGMQVDPEVAAFYRSHAGVGSEELDRSNLPTLKVTESNSSNTLADGSRSQIGYFFYTGDSSEHKELEVSLLSVSRGFYSLDLQKDPKFTQIVCGMMLDTMKPFIMYVAGKRLSNLWEFGKKIAPLTKHPVHPIPMMCMRVNLTLEKVKNTVGTDTHIVNFTLMRLDTFITDRGVLDLLDNGLLSMTQAVESIIENTEVDKNGQPLTRRAEVIQDSQEDYSEQKVEDVTNDIPF